MSQIETVVEELKQLPQAKVAQVAAFVHQLREADQTERGRALAETAGCMTIDEANLFDRLIEEGCERIDRE